jgi:hypothetical protein
MDDFYKIKLVKMFPVLYSDTLKLQTDLQKIGIAWHNDIFGECCDDFGCCTNIGIYHMRYKMKEIN